MREMRRCKAWIVFVVVLSPSFVSYDSSNLIELKNDTPNLSPVADCGENHIAFEGDLITFDGSQSYDPDMSVGWLSLEPLPFALEALAMSSYKGRIFAFGGDDLDPDTGLSFPTGYTNIYDPATDSWSRGSQMPTPRGLVSSVTFNGRIWVIGGHKLWQNDPTLPRLSSDDVEVYDPANDTWEVKNPLPRAPNQGWAASTVLDETIVVVMNDGLTYAYNPSNDTWNPKASIPVVLGNHDIAGYDGKVYVFGGITISGVQDTTWIFDAVGNTWTLGPPMPTARRRMSAVVWGENIFVLGGTPKAYDPIDVVEVFNPNTGNWRTEESLPTARLVLDSAIAGNELYAIGGRSYAYLPVDVNEVFTDRLSYLWDFGDGSLNVTGMKPTHVYGTPGVYEVTLAVTDVKGASDTDSCTVTVLQSGQSPVADAGPDQVVKEGDFVQFDGTASTGGGNSSGKWVWKAPVPSFRMGGGSATLDDEIYFIGGVGSPDGMGGLMVQDAVEKYSPVDDVWYKPTHLPEPRSGLGAAAVGGKIYVIGGNNGTDSTDTTFDYNPVTGIWTEKASMPMPLEGFGIATLNGRIYITGGFSTLIDCYPCAGTYEYDPRSDSWTPKADLPTGRNALASVALNGKIYSIGGDANGLMDEVEVYDPITNTWTSAAGMIGPRSHLRAEVLGGNIFAMGGYENLGTPWVVHVYNPSLDNWTVLEAQLVEPRIAPGSGVVDSCIYLLGGHSGHIIGILSLNEQYCLDGELNYEWDFDATIDSNGDGNFTNDADGTGPTPTHVYYDDGNYTVTLKVTDGAGLWDTDSCIITVLNLPPTADAGGPYSSFEGTPVQLVGNHTDPGSLDTHAYEWDLDYDGATFTPDAMGNPCQKTWYDDHSGNIALKVTDDDGGWSLDVTTVTIENVAPTAEAGEDKEGYEVSTFTFNGSLYDSGTGDTHTFEWDFDYDGTTFDVDATGQTASHTYSDDFDGLVALRVTDDDGGVGIDTAHVLVKNVPPTVTLEALPIEVNASLRIAGEKWHDVTVEMYEDGQLITSGTIVRYPGSPDDQRLDLTQLQVDYSKKYSAIVRYTPEDDPINGQPNGANPCWIILTFGDGQEMWIHHTFNVQHPDTHVWEVDLTAAILMYGLTFQATASDPGADDLTFHWDFGDGTNATSFHPNANGTYPVEITETMNHSFPGSGTYVVVLTVEDDDGGVGTASVTIVIP